MIVEYDCRSFIEFVCRLSLEPNADPNEPGTEETIQVIRMAEQSYTKFRLQRVITYSHRTSTGTGPGQNQYSNNIVFTFFTLQL